ncbi:hypothetical protein [Streptomyces solicathayae]|uniref:Uncharacterized protein n=1 Tax=Streptomyces solicathayae TaxID=3081768 RepID=A0ABZ0LL54_9ACTN|nr:hypothetical protein [Streptomyces sp. HUAS YS2]WOX20152.1 hypothetical protein R2D22_01590 [Streptomyces sp. HUAS YS2]
MNRETVTLGRIDCPSGELVVVDGGYLGLWSGDGSPADVEPELLGIHDPQLAADVAAASDFVIAGADAAAAAASFDRQPGRTVYDIPASQVPALREFFDAHCREHGLDARLERLPERSPHRERVRRCAAYGGGGFLVHGVPVVAVGGLPRDRTLPVLATVAADEAGGPWADLHVRVSDAPVARSVALGEVGVDWARVFLGDADALSAWQHEDSLDGLADVAFWGRHVAEAAAALSAPELGEPGEDGVRGWRDLKVADALVKARSVLEWKAADPDRRLAVDFRPHSHHWRMMRGIRGYEAEAADIEVRGARVFGAMTGIGDGFFPVRADLDAEGGLVAVRILLTDSPVTDAD